MMPVPAAAESVLWPKKLVVLVEVTIETTLFDTLSAMSAIEPSVKLAELPSVPPPRNVIGVPVF